MNDIQVSFREAAFPFLIRKNHVRKITVNGKVYTSSQTDENLIFSTAISLTPPCVVASLMIF
jgi:hypothetical protein